MLANDAAQKRVTFRCTGTGFGESDTFASQLHWDVEFLSGVLGVLNSAVNYIGRCDVGCLSKNSLLREVSWKILVLEGRICIFRRDI